jgi:hypothetical protein
MERIEIARSYWNIINLANFEELRDLLDEQARIIYPNTREIFISREKYIEFNKAYPGRWFIQIEKIASVSDGVVTVTKVTEPEARISFYTSTWFVINNGKIEEITEYWGENSDPPEWRANGNYTIKY